MKSYFVTGTDTDAGKTVVTRGLMRKAVENGYKVAGFKPVSAGCEKSLFGLRNADAMHLMSEANVELPYKQVNPIAYEKPIAPHIAAAEVGESISLQVLNESYEAFKTDADMLFVEGAGGWRLPLGTENGKQQFLSDFAVAHKMPVILVVGLKLGCLNHALLTHQAVETDGLDVVGWVANILNGNMSYLEENIAELKKLLPSPCLGVVPYLSDKDSAARHIQLPAI